MNLPNSAFFERLSSSRFSTVIGGILYEEADNAKNPKDWITLFGVKTPLKQIISLESLAEMYLRENMDTLKRQILEKGSKQEEHSILNIFDCLPENQRLENIQIARFVIEVFNIYLKEKSQGSGGFYGLFNEKEIIEKLKKLSSPREYSGGKFGDFVAINGNIFNLFPTNSIYNSNCVIEVSCGKKYSLCYKEIAKKQELMRIEKAYKEKVLKTLLEFWEKKSSKALKILENSELVKRLVADISKGSAGLPEKNIFYLREGAKHYIYTHIKGEYILWERKDNTYYRFPECDVGVEIQANQNGIYVVPPYPIIISEYVHPGSPGELGKYKKLCCGENDAITLALKGNASPLEKTLTALNLVEFSLKNAYVSQSNAFSPIYIFPGKFEKLKINIRDPKHKRIPITNKMTAVA